MPGASTAAPMAAPTPRSSLRRETDSPEPGTERFSSSMSHLHSLCSEGKGRRPSAPENIVRAVIRSAAHCAGSRAARHGACPATDLKFRAIPDFGDSMKALCWHGKHDIRYETVPDPAIEHPRDAIVKTTCCAICGSDLHSFDGFVPGMKAGDIVGHEFMGEVVEVGPENRKLKVGDRLVVPFTIACGRCFFCEKQLWSLCDNSNANAWMAEK